MRALAVSAVLFLGSATTYFISPSGADTNDGRTASTAWRTMAAALPKLDGGLVFAPGTYTGGTFTCAANQTGLTFAAERERQAELVTPTQLHQCNDVTIAGLTLRESLVVRSTGAFTARRCLMVSTGATIAQLEITSRSARIEENEFREWGAKEALYLEMNDAIVRLNFFTSAFATAQQAVTLRGSTALIENNVFESNLYGAEALQGRTTFRGNLLRTSHGILLFGESSAVSGTVIENNVIMTTGLGVRALGARENVVANNTIVSHDEVLSTASPSYPGAWGRVSANYLFGVSPMLGDSVSPIFENNNEVRADGGVLPGASLSRFIDLQGCDAYPPTTSPLWTMSADGGRIGAAVLFRGSGTAGEGLLWLTDGGFPCGAEVSANLASPKCTEIGRRWGVDRLACRLPGGDAGAGAMDAGVTDAGVTDGGATDGGVTDAGAVDADAGRPGPRFVSVPSLVARCNVPYEYRVKLDRPSALSLEQAPPGAVLIESLVRWPAPTGASANFTLLASNERTSVQQAFTVEVDCPSGCSASPLDPALLAVLLGLRLARGRRARTR